MRHALERVFAGLRSLLPTSAPRAPEPKDRILSVIEEEFDRFGICGLTISGAYDVGMAENGRLGCPLTKEKVISLVRLAALSSCDPAADFIYGSELAGNIEEELRKLRDR